MLLLSCSKENKELKEPTSIFYFNDFENKSAFRDLVGYGLLSGDTAETCGDSSLVISGGCEIPHISIDLPIPEDMTIRAHAFVKGEEPGCGEIGLFVRNNEHIGFRLGGKNWTHVISDGTLSVKKGEVLKVFMISGGFGACVSYLDNFTIEKVN